MHHIPKIVTFSSLGLLFLLIAGVGVLVRPKTEPKVTVGLVEFKAEIADSPSEWRRGLVGHAPLAKGEGLLFIFPNSNQRTFWMKDMSFPIDIVWISNGEVIGYVDDAKPDQGEILYSSPGATDRVLEISSGERRRLGITIGAPVSVE